MAGSDAGVVDAKGDAPVLAAPVVLARLPGCGAAHLAIAGTHVLWTETATGLVKSLSVTDAGGTPALIAKDQAMPGVIAADETYIYWANDGDKTIMKAQLTGAPAAPLLTAPDVVGGLVASGGTLYYGAGSSAYKVASGGGAPTTLMTFATCRMTKLGAIALDADHLYQTDHINQYISREKIDGTQANNNQCVADPASAPKIPSPDVISHSQGSLVFDALAVVGAEIVWAGGPNINAKPVTGNNGTTGRLVGSTLGANDITGFVVAGGKVYFGESSDPPGVASGDSIQVVPFDPGDAGPSDPTVVATGQKNASQFVADATNLYWVTRTPPAAGAGADECAIVRLAR